MAIFDKVVTNALKEYEIKNGNDVEVGTNK